MSKDTDKTASNVQAFPDFGQFLANHPQGQAIKRAVEEQGVAQVQAEDPQPTAPSLRKPSCP